MNRQPLLLSCLLMLAMLPGTWPASAGQAEFHQPRPGLHTGGQPSAEQLAMLSQQGVHTVIDLRGEAENRGYDEAAAARHLGLTYVALPIAGADAITPANAAALRALLDEHGDGVLLHCASGNRVGALLALDGLHAGLPREQALALGRKAGLKSLEPAVVEKMDVASARCPDTQSGKAC